MLLTLFATYQTGITLFTHVHYVNGVMITHSHPSKEKHSHSKTELVVIDRLSVFQTLAADAPVHLKPIFSLLAYVETPVRIPLITSTHLRVLSLRAPPHNSVS